MIVPEIKAVIVWLVTAAERRLFSTVITSGSGGG